MSNKKSYVAADGSYVEDITHLFMPKSEDDGSLRSFVNKIEEKVLNGLKKKDIAEMLEQLKIANEKIESQDTQILAMKKDNAQQKRLNMEMCLMIDQMKETGKQDPETSERIKSVVRAFRTDMFTRFFLLHLEGVEIEVTYQLMKQIIYWYPKGKVYFAKGEFFQGDITTDKAHKYTFLETVVCLDHTGDESKNREALVVGETAYTVHLLFVEDFLDQSEAVLAPTLVLQGRVKKFRDDGREDITVSRRMVLSFMLNMGYECPINGLG